MESEGGTRRIRATRRWLIGAAGSALAICCGLPAPFALGQTVTVGESTLTPSLSPPVVGSGQGIPVFQGASGPGYVLRSPQAGTITSWSFLSAGIATGKHFMLRVLEPIGPEGKSWRAAGSSTEVAVTSGAGVDTVNGPFPAALAIKAGDAIALQPTDDNNVPSEEGTLGVDGIRYFAAPLAEGASAELSPGSEANNGQLIPVQATVQYTAAAATPPPPGNSAAPSLSGVSGARVRTGQTLSCRTGSWTAGSSLAVGWYTQYTAQDHSRQLSASRLFGTGTSLKLPSLPPGRGVYCQVTASNAGGTASARSPALTIAAVKPALARHTAGRPGTAPRIVKGVVPGHLEECSAGSWQNYPSTFKYQWLLGPARGRSSGGRVIGRGQFLKVRSSYAGSAVRCRVTAANEAGKVVATSVSTVVPRVVESFVSVSCGEHPSSDTGCPGTAINVIVPGQPAGHSLNPPSKASAPLFTSARDPAIPRTGRYLLECMPPRFNKAVKVTYKWTITQMDFFTYELHPKYVAEGFDASYEALTGHFLTIDHGILEPKPLVDEPMVGWSEVTTDDKAHKLERVLQYGPGVLRISCEAIGSAGSTSDWGRSPVLFVQGTEGFFNEDGGVVGYTEEPQAAVSRRAD